MASPTWGRDPFPWREISPSLGLVVAIVVMIVGVRTATFAIPLAGGLMAIGCFFWAAILEFQANRHATATQGEPGAMNMLSQSSDWPSVMRGGRRRQS